VGLVDDEQPGRVGELRQLLVTEPRVVEALGADQQQVDFSGRERGVDLPPLVGVGGVDGHRGQPGALRGRDLVAHQRQQWRDDDRRAATASPQQCSGHEVDSRLAPPGALYDENSPPAVDQRLDGLELTVAKRGRVVTDQPLQDDLGLTLQGWAHIWRRH
jgi:hypothetical protein